jgi:uroporphyrinogen-III synthase
VRESALKSRRKPTNEDLLKNARQMRHVDTRAEKHAWVLLRNRRMFSLKFRRQFPIENYIVDFYCDELRLVVELDGGVHADPDQVRNDEIRDIHLRELGYQVLRVPNGIVINAPDQFAAEIKRCLPSPGASRHPLPEGEG